ncbi:MAG: hypothetical protein IKP87_02755 [Victivallales bacterium]|nr:hypothetical protein [Victivallales bacterium]
MAVTENLAVYLGYLPTEDPVNQNPNFEGTYNKVLHLDDVYLALIIAAQNTEHRVENSLENYIANPDVQANLQQLQYDLQSWNLALTTSTNMQKNMSDALKSIVSNLR